MNHMLVRRVWQQKRIFRFAWNIFSVSVCIFVFFMVTLTSGQSHSQISAEMSHYVMPRAVWKSAEISWYLCGFSCSSRVFHWPQFGIEVQHSKLVRGLRLVHFYIPTFTSSTMNSISKSLALSHHFTFSNIDHPKKSPTESFSFLTNSFVCVFLFFLCENFPSSFLLLYNWENFHKTKFSLDIPTKGLSHSSITRTRIRSEVDTLAELITSHQRTKKNLLHRNEKVEGNSELFYRCFSTDCCELTESHSRFSRIFFSLKCFFFSSRLTLFSYRHWGVRWAIYDAETANYFGEMLRDLKFKFCLDLDRNPLQCWHTFSRSRVRSQRTVTGLFCMTLSRLWKC